MINQSCLALALAASFALASPALAHDGPRVWVSADDGRLVTLAGVDVNDETSYAPASVFETTLSPYFGVYTTQFPGYEAPRDGSGAVGDGTSIGFRIAGPLLTLDASSTGLIPTARRFAAAAPQMEVAFPDVPPEQAAAFTRHTSTGVVDGYVFTDTITEHAHLAYTLLGDGASASAVAPDGVYVLPMRLTSPTLAASDWYFLSFAKNASVSERTAASIAAQSMADARPGDANFDGAIDFDDLLALAQHYGTAGGAWWADGDFDFDGSVGFDDLLALAQGYGSNAFANDWALARQIVPEPIDATFAIGVLLLSARRRALRF